ncbi:MAG TPA: hypothetical protein VFV68_09985 [Agriterribacter sp.]|nr:hypothetical protein [Agriterribacter sp.]
MKTIFYLFLFCAGCLLLFSCQKELSIDTLNAGNPGNGGGTTNTSLVGNWNLISLDVKTESISSYDLDGATIKGIAKYQAVTENNKGYFSISSNIIKAIGLSYSLSTDVVLETYLGPLKTDEQTIPLEMTMPPYDATSNYQQVNNDSIYLPEGVVFDIPDAGTQPTGANEPVGATYTIQSDTLKIKANFDKSMIVNQGGIDFQVHQTGTAIYSLKKQ